MNVTMPATRSRNALIPMVTYCGIQLAGLLTGAVVTEQVFSRPGLAGRTLGRRQPRLS